MNNNITSIDFELKYLKQQHWDVISRCYEVLGANIKYRFPQADHMLIAQKLADLLPLIQALDLTGTCCKDRLKIEYNNETSQVSMSIVKQNTCEHNHAINSVQMR